MNLKLSLLVTAVLSLTILGSWEAYWRTKPEYYKAYLEDSKYLWAKERAKVELTSSEGIILLGSSRSGYDFNTHAWKNAQGKMPINLAVNGQNPGPYFNDIVNNTSFNGTLIISITTVACFWPKEESWGVGEQWIDFYNNQTYAQKLGEFISKPLQRNLVMLSKAASYNDLDLKAFLNRIQLGNRIEDADIKLINFGYNDEDRNLYMFDRMTKDAKYRKEITDAWDRVLPTVPDYETIKEGIPGIINVYKTLAEKFKERGGSIIFIRHKCEDEWQKYSQRIFPDEEVWDKFVEAVDSPTYYFEDYEFMSKYNLPDWSHMTPTDANTYTKEMVNKLIEDKHLTKKTN